MEFAGSLESVLVLSLDHILKECWKLVVALNRYLVQLSKLMICHLPHVVCIKDGHLQAK